MSEIDNTEITNHTDLALRIMHLKSERFDQETELKHTAKEFVYHLSPINMLKGSIRELASDREVQRDLTKVGINMGTHFIIDKVLGKNRSIKGFLSSLLVGNIASSLISNNMPKIISGISKLVHRKPEHENQE
ncbi:MAG: hypothetical protein SGJ10_07310 [Bacteroidota bacterium]|nr:hypothetical protein [Bacteroidota bacterium]